MNENIKTFFDSIAVDYTHNESPLIDDLLDSLFIEKSHRLLDLGCGKGIISSKLAKKSGGEVIGLDISSEMIKYAKESTTNSKVKFINGDFYEFNDSPFDAIICFDAFPHFIDVDGFAKKANELLNKDGLLAILHDIGRPTLNTHHKQHALKVSRVLKEPSEEVKPLLKYFKPIELSESDNYYKIILIKKDS